MSSPSSVTVRQAILLGALHGPAELLPISSSAHTALVPWLLGWPYPAQATGEARKSFEVALHAGTAAALLITLRREVRDAFRRPRVLALASLPPAAAGYALERPIERRLGTPPLIAVALSAGAAAMTLADRVHGRRRIEDADAADALWLGLAQALALIPGVSRNGATVTAARFRGFATADAGRLSRQVALPVIGGATLLKVVRSRGEAERGPLVAGAGAAFASTLALSRFLVADRPLTPFAVYRALLAAVVAKRWRAVGSDTRSGQSRRIRT